jgi:hypothetical protein
LLDDEDVIETGSSAASWELLLTAAAKHHKIESYYISLAWEKIQIQKSKDEFY